MSGGRGAAGGSIGRPNGMLVIGVVVTLVGAVLSTLSMGQGTARALESAANQANQERPNEVVVDGATRGRAFDGVGGIFGHGATRLLADYPKREREELLDYMFEPGYGASMQLIKVEIGGDINATTGTTPSHMRAPGEVNCERGHEWWLMKEAKKRNPDIRIAGLQWGAPGWFDGGFWSQENIDYLKTWLDCADSHGLDIDYMGGWNESGFEPDWFVQLDRALEEDHPDIKIVAADEAASDDPHKPVIEEMQRNPEFRRAVDIVGWHSPCGNRVARADCPTPEAARELGKPLWTSETSAQAHDAGAAPMARTLNRGYVDGKITAHMFWPALWAGYGHQSLADTGMMLAQWPWSGHYEVGDSVWAMAHTAQFTEPGWRYLDSGSARLDSGASVASLRAPSGDDYSMIVEAMDVRRATTATLRLKNLPDKALQLWSSDLSTETAEDDFVHVDEVTPSSGRVQLRLEPGHVYTLSTRTDAGRGSAASDAGVGMQLDLPYREEFDGYAEQRQARYFSDVSGSFQTEPCAAAREGLCYEQAVTAQPIDWHGPDMAPVSLVGDPRWWGDYRASVDAHLTADTSYVELLGRVDGVQKDEYVSGYRLRLSSDGSWRLYSEAISGKTETLDSGELSGFDEGWHRLSMSMQGSRIRVVIDGERVGQVSDAHDHRVGSVGVATSKWDAAQFDDLRVVPAGRAPAFLPQQEMSATASSQQPGTPYGFEYPAEAVIDGRSESYWRSRWEPLEAPPHAVTLDLGAPRTVRSLTYQPDIERPFYLDDPGSAITDYEIWLSSDGETFERVDSGVWPATLAATKVATLDRAHEARYVRLVVPEGGSACGPASVTVGELNVSSRAIADPTPDSAGVGLDDPVPQEQMSASATSHHAGYEPGRAIDGDCDTMWHSAFRSDEEPGLVPQAITLDLGGSREVSEMSYLPRQDGVASGTITEYAVLLSSDGTTYTEVGKGQWASGSGRKSVRWKPRTARYLRLRATAAANDVAAAAEIQVGAAPSG